MAERQWTVVIVPNGAGGSRSVQVSLRALRISLVVLGAFAFGAALFGYTAVSKTIDLSRLDRLERRNQLLTQELERAQLLVADLGDTVAAITKLDQQVRLLAGLDPTDPQVQLAGVGGPTPPWTEREHILSEGAEGRGALAMRADLDALIRRANLLSTSFGEALESLTVHVDRLERTPSISPISPTLGWLTSPFSQSRIHPIHHEARPHEGIDISAPKGTPILAPASGRVVDVSARSGYGKMVTIDHGNGIVTRYAHCEKILVRVGQWVKRNEKVALVGNTGIATAPHLHYEVIVRGRPIDPRTYIFPEQIVD